MTREEYEEIASAYEQMYLDYSKVMRSTNPEPSRVEAAVELLEELRLLMRQYEDEHPEAFRGQGGNDQSERANQPVQDNPSPASESKDDILSEEEFFKELEGMDGSDAGPSQRPDQGVLKAALFDRLREAGIASVSVEYDGACDSGCIEHVSAFGVGDRTITLSDDLRELVEEYVYERLPGGWEINDGSFGEVEIDSLAGTVRFDHNQRYTDYQPWEE